MSRLAKVAGGNEPRVEPVTRKILTRRDLLRAGAAGAAGLAGSGLGVTPAVRAAEPTLRFPGMGRPEDGMTYDDGPSAKIHRLGEPNRFTRRRDGVALRQQQIITEKERSGKDNAGVKVLERGRKQDHGHPLDLGTIDSVLWGTGLFIGNEFLNWSDSTRASVFARIANWGFYFASPKVGGYGSTWYGSDDQLRSWRDMCWNNGIGFAPFIYSIPSTYYRDAQICSEIANAVGIAIVDMEDEWAYYYNTMTQFGNVFRSYNPYDAICVTGYGDPITRFGRGVFPSAQLTQWADGYMPQWYYGVWSVYHQSGVYAAINWGDNECGQELGWSYPLCPNLSIYSAYTGNGILPYNDISTGEEYSWNWQAPIIWWEYSGVNDTVAYYCLN